jgi:hypothetical protein
MNTPGFLRYYNETLDLLLERGHEVVLGFISTTLRANALEALEGRPRRPQLIGEVPSRSDALVPMSVRLRNLVDFALPAPTLRLGRIPARPPAPEAARGTGPERLAGPARERVAVTGAQPFDRWFCRPPP